VAVTWTLVGILAAFSLGVLTLLTAQHGRLDGRLDAMNARLDGLSARMDELARDLRQEIRSVVAAIEGRMDRHEAERHGA
jgi:outer membrane protein TolC